MKRIPAPDDASRFAITVKHTGSNNALLRQDSDIIVVHPEQIPALIEALQEFLPPKPKKITVGSKVTLDMDVALNHIRPTDLIPGKAYKVHAIIHNGWGNETEIELDKAPGVWPAYNYLMSRFKLTP